MSLRAAALCLLALPLAADGPHFGVQGQAVKGTTGSLRKETEDKTGTSVGIHLDVNPDGGHVLRYRLDYLKFPERPGAVTNEKLQLEGRGGGVDYLWYWRGRPEGGYLALGAAITEWRFKDSAQPKPDKKQLLNGSVGVGSQLNRFMGVELRYTLSNLDTETRFRPNFYSAQVILHF